MIIELAAIALAGLVVYMFFRAAFKGPVPGFDPEILKRVKRLGRNDQCPCGSKLNYKDCHLKSDSEIANRYVQHQQHSSAAFGNGLASRAGIALRGFRKWGRWGE